MLRRPVGACEFDVATRSRHSDSYILQRQLTHCNDKICNVATPAARDVTSQSRGKRPDYPTASQSGSGHFTGGLQGRMAGCAANQARAVRVTSVRAMRKSIPGPTVHYDGLESIQLAASINNSAAPLYNRDHAGDEDNWEYDEK
ncbi:hypothetical protein H4Q26_003189 [Puccinia striiformis f. sp. tritici PST-130]|nr:hypothetical protein H4Q26_003189 [Puccinia striiformis f. sp. tritici PST-130]